MTRIGVIFKRRVAEIGTMARAGDLDGVRRAALDAWDWAETMILAAGGEL